MLTPTQARMAAASLELDGRTDIAANVLVPGHISEFTYLRGQAASPKAQALEATLAALDGMVQLLGLQGTIAALREGSK